MRGSVARRPGLTGASDIPHQRPLSAGLDLHEHAGVPERPRTRRAGTAIETVEELSTEVESLDQDRPRSDGVVEARAGSGP